jgi:hypothetical protein
MRVSLRWCHFSIIHIFLRFYSNCFVCLLLFFCSFPVCVISIIVMSIAKVGSFIFMSVHDRCKFIYVRTLQALMAGDQSVEDNIWQLEIFSLYHVAKPSRLYISFAIL